MREIFRCAVEIIEYEDNSLTVQVISPEGTLSDFYGKYLGCGQVAKLGVKLFNNPDFWDWGDVVPSETEEHHIKEMKTKTILEKLRRRWEAVRSNTAPKVFAEHGAICAHCGVTENLTIDHIIPLAKGGTNDLDNLQPLCKSCNSSKGAR